MISRGAGPIAVVAAQRAWQLAGGIVTAVLLVHFLTPEQQGWYYGFTNAAALFTLFDSGLSLILVQRTASLRSGLELSDQGEPHGELAPRFAALTSYARRWYGISSALFLTTLLPGGLLFFASAKGPDAVPSWQALWTVLLFATALNLWLLPFLSLVEGSGKVATVYGVRLAQGIAGSFCCWLALVAGAGAWACLGMPVASAVLGLFWLYLCKPSLLALKGNGIDNNLRADLLPQHWRLGLSWTSGFLLTQIYSPLLLSAEGATVAGQMGLTLTVTNILALISHSWLTHAYPEMSALAAKREWRTVTAVFKRAMWFGTGSYVAGAAVAVGIAAMASGSPYMQRLLPVPAIAALFAATFVNQFCAGLAVHMRSASREPFVWISAAGAALTLAGAAAVLGQYGVVGLVVVMVLVQALFVLPLYLGVWHSQRKALEGK